MQLAEQTAQWGSTDISAERHVPRLVEPEVLLPSQYYEAIAGHSILEGEKRLMLAVLEDAVSCYQKFFGADRGRRKRLLDEAAQWLFEEEGDWVFSFESICGALEIDAECLRRGLLSWKERQQVAGEGAALPRFSRVRLRAARRHKILPFRDRRRKLAAVA